MNHPEHIETGYENYDYSVNGGLHIIESLTTVSVPVWACMKKIDEPSCFHEPVLVWALSAVYEAGDGRLQGNFRGHEVIGLVATEGPELGPPAGNFLGYVDSATATDVCAATLNYEFNWQPSA